VPPSSSVPHETATPSLDAAELSSRHLSTEPFSITMGDGPSAGIKLASGPFVLTDLVLERLPPFQAVTATYVYVAPAANGCGQFQVDPTNTTPPKLPEGAFALHSHSWFTSSLPSSDPVTLHGLRMFVAEGRVLCAGQAPGKVCSGNNCVMRHDSIRGVASGFHVDP
jgi:hypothetical protein